MSKFIKLTNPRDVSGDLIINVDLIRIVIPKYNGCSVIEFSDEHNVAVNETPERIFKMIKAAK